MKQRDLVKKLEKAGFEFARHGGNHDIYKRGDDEEKIPRHREINERLARAILRKPPAAAKRRCATSSPAFMR